MLTTKIIGSRIVAARKGLNISQAQLAQRLFISPQAVGKWERGESMPDITPLNRLAEVLGVDLNYFSDKFQSTVTEMSSDTPLAETVTALPVGNKERKPLRDMSHGNWIDVDFSGLKNLYEKFSSSNMKHVRFVASELMGLLLKNNHIEDCNFTGSDISDSCIQGSYLVNNLFKECCLKDAEFVGSYIKNCNFTEADFSGTRIQGSSLQKSTLTNAVWNGTTFSTTQLSEVVFEDIVQNCSFENCDFSNVTFRHATLIETLFRGKNLKGIQFIECKADHVTYAFLKSGKADLSGIILLTALTALTASDEESPETIL